MGFPDNLCALRQPILYAEELWRRQRLWPLMFVGAGIVLSVFMLVGRHGVVDANVLVGLVYVPCGLLFGAALLFYRRRNYAEVTESGLKVSSLLSQMVISYDEIRNTRVQPLERHFQEGRARYLRTMAVRPLRDRPALFIRLKVDDARLAQIRRKLGSQLVADDTVAIPVADPNALSWEVTSRLPERTSVNLGGRRRRPRRGR